MLGETYLFFALSFFNKQYVNTALLIIIIIIKIIHSRYSIFNNRKNPHIAQSLPSESQSVSNNTLQVCYGSGNLFFQVVLHFKLPDFLIFL